MTFTPAAGTTPRPDNAIELMDIVTFTASAAGYNDEEGNPLTVNWTHFQVKDDSGSWITATKDSQTTEGEYNETHTITKTMRSVGKPGGNSGVVFRIAAEAGDKSDMREYTVYVNFPNRNRIEANAITQSHTTALWQQTLNDCTDNPNQRRELGCWFAIDTQTGSFTPSPTQSSPFVGPNDPVKVQLGTRPQDDLVDVNNGGKYWVASFHTHTPTTFRTLGRAGGPTVEDRGVDILEDVVGLVFDYQAEFVPPQHPKASPAGIYKTDLLRRTKP